jgi:hypothetical protein
VRICDWLAGYEDRGWACGKPAIYRFEDKAAGFSSAWYCAEHYDIYMQVAQKLRMAGKTVQEWLDEDV